VAVLEPKQYKYLPDLLVKIFLKRRNVPGRVSQRLSMDPDDPKIICPNIAIVPPPTVEELLQSHKSRFGD
jgi:hypothetical protein